MPESGPVSEGRGGNGTDLALEKEGDELGSEGGGLGIQELGAEFDRLLQLIGLQNSEIDSDLPGSEPRAAPETTNSDSLARPRPLSAWYRGRYPLHQTLPLCQQQEGEGWRTTIAR